MQEMRLRFALGIRLKDVSSGGVSAAEDASLKAMSVSSGAFAL